MPRYPILIILLCLTLGVNAQPRAGEMVNDITLKDLNGNSLSLSSFRGKVVLLDFWASWCGPCRRENKGLLAIYRRLSSKGFEIYSISIDEDAAAWKQAVQQDHINWVQVNDSGGWNGSVAAKWNIEQIPSTFLLDKKGKLVAIDLEGRELESRINQLLRE